MYLGLIIWVRLPVYCRDAFGRSDRFAASTCQSKQRMLVIPLVYGYPGLQFPCRAPDMRQMLPLASPCIAFHSVPSKRMTVCAERWIEVIFFSGGMITPEGVVSQIIVVEGV